MWKCSRNCAGARIISDHERDPVRARDHRHSRHARASRGRLVPRNIPGPRGRRTWPISTADLLLLEGGETVRNLAIGSRDASAAEVLALAGRRRAAGPEHCQSDGLAMQNPHRPRHDAWAMASGRRSYVLPALGWQSAASSRRLDPCRLHRRPPPGFELLKRSNGRRPGSLAPRALHRRAVQAKKAKRRSAAGRA